MRIKNIEDADRFRELIGEENYAGIGRALADGAWVWLFRTEKEILDSEDLEMIEKLDCLKILTDQGLGYAGWIRTPARRPLPWFERVVTSHGFYDSHGNYHNGGGSEGSRH